MEKNNYMLPWDCPDLATQPSEEMRSRIGTTSPVTRYALAQYSTFVCKVIMKSCYVRFVRMLLALLDSGAARPHLKYLTELFR